MEKQQWKKNIVFFALILGIFSLSGCSAVRKTAELLQEETGITLPQNEESGLAGIDVLADER